MRNRWYGALIGDALASTFVLRLEDGAYARWETIDTCSTNGIDVSIAAGSRVTEAALESALRAAAASTLRGHPSRRG